MSKRAEELANKLYPDPKIEDYDDILVYRADRDNAIMGRANAICIYEQAEKDLALKWEDIEEIYKLVLEVEGSGEYACFPYGKPIYEEALRRFLESKN